MSVGDRVFLGVVMIFLATFIGIAIHRAVLHDVSMRRCQAAGFDRGEAMFGGAVRCTIDKVLP